MSRSEVEIIERGQAWLAEGERVVLATVAHTWGSSPRPPGAVMVMSASGRIAGSVSGGCIEQELLARVREDFPDAFETIEYNSDTSRALPCGGLRTPAFYVGALGSGRTTAKRAARLIEYFEMSADHVKRIRGPIGIDLNTRKPSEIALAVMTDITAVRNGVRVSTERLAS